MPAYGATNVRDDPRYWEAHLTHVNPNIRAQAHTNLARIQNEQRMQQHAAQFATGQTERRAAQQERLAATRLAHEESMGMQRQKAQETAAYRHAQLGQTAETAASRKSVGWLNLAQNPDLLALYGDKAPAIKKYALNQYFQSLQGGGAPAGAGAAGGVEGLAGGQASNPRAAAVRNDLQASGKQVTPQTAPSPTNAPAAVPQRGNVAGVPPQPQGGGGPSDLVGGDEGGVPAGYPQGSYMTPSGIPHIGGSPAMPLNQLIQHGTIVGGPEGKDLNINTGEWVPSDLVGTINGRPAPQVIAEGALKRGVSPEDTRSRAVYNSMIAEAGRQYGQATPPQGGPSRDVLMNRPGPAGLQQNIAQGVGAPPNPVGPGAVVPERIPTDATGERQWPSGAASSGLHSGQWLADQFKGLVSNVSFGAPPPVEGRPAPPPNILPELTADQRTAIEAQRRAEEEARRRAAERGR